MASKIFRDGLLEGQVALVTGGGTGIGARVALELASLGAQVVIASRDEARLQAAATAMNEALSQGGTQPLGTLWAHPVDIREAESVARLYAALLARCGRLDILVNNGGGQFFSPAQQISQKGFDAVVATNLGGSWKMMRGAADGWMLEHGGAIVNITMLTDRAFPGMAHSVAARSGVEGLTKTLAVEWAEQHIRVNCVAPGFVASSGLKRYPFDAEWLKGLQSLVPLKRLASMEEIAWAVVYLAGPSGAYITGETLTVDGGKTQWGDYWEIPDPEPLPEVLLPDDPGES